MQSEDRLYSDLQRLDMPYELVEHEAVFTVEQSRKIDRDLPGAHTKNLFLKDNASQFWLITVPAQAKVDLKTLPSAIGSKRVSFGKAEDMERLLGVMPGSVTPLAAINDKACEVQVVLDQSLSQVERINIHPLRNTATLGMAPADLIRLLGYWNHTPVVSPIPTLENA